jgi:hypothetical protein
VVGDGAERRVIINVPPGYKGCKGFPPGSCPVCIPISKKSDYCYFCEMSQKLTRVGSLHA